MTELLSLYKGVISTPPRRPGTLSDATFKRVLNQVAERTGIAAEAILGDSRTRRIAQPRQELMWRLHRLGYSYPAIACKLKRDHTSCLHGVRAHQARIITQEIEEAA